MVLLKPPPPLVIVADGNIKQSFIDWKQKFEIYYMPNEADKKLSAEQREALLLHTIGDESINIYNTFDNKENLSFEDLLLQIENTAVHRTMSPLHVSRHLFFSRLQKEGKTYDEFFTYLKKLSLDFNFEKLRDWGVFRHQIIMDIRYNKLTQRMLQDF